MGISRRSSKTIIQLLGKGAYRNSVRKMMERNYKKIVAGGIIFLLVLLFCVFGAVIYFASTKDEADGKAEVNVKTETDSEELPEAEEEKTEATEMETEESEEPEEPEAEELPMELTGLPDDVMKIMGITRSQIADALKEWTEENGYSSADGAVFQEPVYLRFDDLKFSVSFQLTFGEEGNGITPEDTVLTMDYYQKQNQIFFHK